MNGTLQDAIAARPSAWGRRSWPRPRLGARLRRGDRRRPRPHERPQPRARRGRRSRSPTAAARRRPSPAPTPTSTSPCWRWTPATSRRSRWEPADATPAHRRGPCVALANPGGRGLRATLGFVSSGGRSFRGPRGRRIRGAIEHTAPLPRGSSGGPLVDPDGNLLGINSIRLDGGLILAVPAGAAVKERVLRPRARRGRGARTGSAWRSRRRGWRAACAARSACRSATACWCARSRTAARARRPASSAAT